MYLFSLGPVNYVLYILERRYNLLYTLRQTGVHDVDFSIKYGSSCTAELKAVPVVVKLRYVPNAKFNFYFSAWKTAF
jgi:hypothetical protein